MGFPVIFNLRYCVELLISLMHYIAFSPSYIHLFFIYAFCRIDDLSWGTKGDNTSDNEKNAKVFESEKLIFVAKWIASNCTFSIILSVLTYDPQIRNYIILVIGYYSTGLVALRCVLSMWFYIRYYFISYHGFGTCC